MQFHITGAVMPTVAIHLAEGEKVYSQTSAMCWMSETIEMDTHAGGGFFAGLQRSMAGGGFFITEFTAKAAGEVCFAPRFPGAIIALTLRDGESLICRKETFLCAEMTVSLEIAWRKRLGAGLFGGEGFILQKVTGPGVVWLELSGEVVEKDLAPGEKLLVNAGHVGIQTTEIDFDIQRVSGFRNILFGGEGLFLATLTGPGHVWLQSLPIMNLAAEIGRYLPLAGGAVAGSSLAGIGAAAASDEPREPDPGGAPDETTAAAGGAAAGEAASVAEAGASSDEEGSLIGDAASTVANVATGIVGGLIGLFGSDDESST